MNKHALMRSHIVYQFDGWLEQCTKNNVKQSVYRQRPYGN